MIDTNIVPSRERDQSDDSFIFRRKPAQQRNNDLAYFLDNLTYDIDHVQVHLPEHHNEAYTNQKEFKQIQPTMMKQKNPFRRKRGAFKKYKQIR